MAKHRSVRRRLAHAASAPTRIDLAGGTLDIWPLSAIVPKATTVNVAIELRATALVEPIDAARVEIVSQDRGAGVSLRLPLADADVAGPLSWPLRLVRALDLQAGARLTIRAEAPAGAGLGGSSALGIAIGAALASFTGERLRPEDLLTRVMNLETAQLAVPTGNQDYLAAIHGGLAAYRHTVDGVVRERLPGARDLGRRLVLAYTGEPRHSGFSNWDMFRRFVDGERRTVRDLEAIARIAREMRDALAARDLDAAGRLLGEEGRLRFNLAPTVATPALRTAGRAARRAGALGVKVCGAGGGGCLVAFAPDGGREGVVRAIASTGAQILPAAVAGTGLETETVERVSAR